MSGKTRKAPKSRESVDNTATHVGGIDLPLTVLGALGVVLTAALSYFAMTQEHLPYCGSGSGCDIVQASRWSKLFDVPISLWGMMVYLAIVASAIAVRDRTQRARFVIFFATVGFAVSIYLNLVSLFAIGALCLYCLASFALISLIYLYSWRTLSPAKLATWRLGSHICALAAVGFLLLHYAGLFDEKMGPEDPYLRALAEHLTATNTKFYGAYWCPHCQQQKVLFGASAARLPYIECSPNGRGAAPATACIQAEIRNFPTWVVAGQRIERTLSISQLAQYSGFDELPDNAPP